MVTSMLTPNINGHLKYEMKKSRHQRFQKLDFKVQIKLIHKHMMLQHFFAMSYLKFLGSFFLLQEDAMI